MATNWNDFEPIDSTVTKSGSVDWSQFEPIKPDNSGDTARGFKRAFAQVPELAYGAAALTATSAEHLFGEGGLSTAAKNYFTDKFTSTQSDNQKYAPSVEFTDAWDNLKNGDIGSMVDWLQDSAGYVVGQGIQTALTGGVGAIAGKTALSAATQKMLGGVVAKQAAKIAEETAAKQGLSETAIAGLMPAATKLASERIAQAIGAGVALNAQNLGMEAGDIYGGLTEESAKSGKPISGEDLLRAWGMAAAAAGTETATDLLGLGALTGRVKIGGKSMQEMGGLSGRAVRGATAAGIGAPLEAGQEYLQTGMEQYGAGQDLNTPEARAERINAAAVGGLGGGLVGGGAGIIHDARAQQAPLPAGVPTPLLTHEPGPPLVVFSDGTTMTAAEARQRGLYQQVGGTQPTPEQHESADIAYTVEKITQAPDVDSAISAAMSAADAVQYDEGAAQAGLIVAQHDTERQAELRQQGIEPQPGAQIPAVAGLPAPELPELTTGARTQEQQLWMAQESARQKQAVQARKDAELDTLQRDSKLPAALYDAERKDTLAQASGALDAAGAPTAMQLAMERARARTAPVAQAEATPETETWKAFPPDTGTLNIPRAEMPQIKAEHRGAMVNFLEARGITHQQEDVPANALKPTQAEFSPEKVRQAQGFTGNDRSILISSDNYIADGHHQAMAKVASGEPISAIRLNAPIKQLLPMLHEFPSSTTAPMPGAQAGEEAKTQIRALEQNQEVAPTPPEPKPVYTAEQLVKIGGRAVEKLELRQLQKFAKKGGPRVKAAAQAEIARRHAADPMNNPDIRGIVEGMKAEVGADDRGGRMIKNEWNEGPDDGERGRTVWTGHAWWFQRPDPISSTDAKTTIDKALAGKKLGERQQRFIDYLVEIAQRNLADETQVQEAAETAGIELTQDDIAAIGDIADAAELDYAAFEAFDHQYRASTDAEYADALQELSDERNRQNEVDDRARQEARATADREEETAEAKRAEEVDASAQGNAQGDSGAQSSRTEVNAKPEASQSAADDRPPLALQAQTEADLAAKSARASDATIAERERVDRESKSGLFNLTADAKPAEIADAEGKAKTGDVLAPSVPAVRKQMFVEAMGERFEVSSFEDASKKWEAFRDKTGAGVSEIGNGVRVVDQDGKELARVSYNGRVWPPGEYKKGAQSLYTPPDQVEKPAPNPMTAVADARRTAADTQKPLLPWREVPPGLTIDVKVEDTGETHDVDARKFLRASSKKLDRLNALMECVRR